MLSLYLVYQKEKTKRYTEVSLIHNYVDAANIDKNLQFTTYLTTYLSQLYKITSFYQSYIHLNYGKDLHKDWADA